MKLVTYLHRNQVSIGKVADGHVVDLPASDPSLPRTMLEFIAAGPAALQRARRIQADNAVAVPLASVQLLAPLANPPKFLALGMNYARHVAEAKAAGIPVPDTQVWFNKQASCINAPYGNVHMPRVSDKLDYEVELGVVIGRACRHVAAADAPGMVFGYVVCNDFSVRDWQMRSPTFTMGKSFDTTGPIGPWIVTADEIPDPHALHMRLLVNGEVRQEEGTSGMVYDVWQQIEHLSTAFTLEPGDLLATGTPSGVGVARKPPQFLKVGDVVRAEIGGIGHIENRIVPEPV